MKLSGSATVAGVMGWPVSHSLSPCLHGYWLADLRIDGAYVPFPVSPGNLEAALRALPALGIAGVNLTLPHKQAALSVVDNIDPVAARIGAVNIVTVTEEGGLEGRNSDGFGFTESLRASAANWRGANGPAVIIGAGGAARAIAVALQDEDVPEIRIVNRTASRARELAASLGGAVTAIAWEERSAALGDAALLVNSTTQGMVGQAALDLALDDLPVTAVVNDIIYAPMETPLLAAASRRGNPVVDGLGMLLHQGRPAFAAWFGTEPGVTQALRDHVLAG
jgi:shikimate dehydrogenase